MASNQRLAASEAPAQRYDNVARSDLAPGLALHHKLSLATTRSTSSASSSSHRSYPLATSSASATSSTAAPLRPSHQSPYTESPSSHQPTGSSRDTTKRIPVYIRIVPKDVWLRLHLDPKQTIGSVKTAALYKAHAPDHDPSLSYRFYQDALNASAHAKIAPVTSHDKVVKHRSYVLPRTFVCSVPELAEVREMVAERLVEVDATRRRRAGKQGRKGREIKGLGEVGVPVPALPVFGGVAGQSSRSGAQSSRQLRSAHSQAQLQQQQQQQQQSASPGSQSRALPLSRGLGGSSSSARTASDDAMASSSAHVTQQISSSTSATSPPSTPSDFRAAHQDVGSTTDPSASSDTSYSHSQAVDEIAFDLDASLITGNRDAKLEEEMARLRLSQWSSARQASSSNAAASSSLTGFSPQRSRMEDSPRLPHSYNSIPTIGSGSNFDSETGLSPNVPSLSSFNADSIYSAQHDTASVEASLLAATPPRRPLRSEQRSSTAAAPAIFYTQPGAAESFNSLASVDSPSSAELVTTADDEARVMQWGTQAEPPSVSEGISPARSLRNAAFEQPLSSPLQAASSPVRPRSRTVTAADVLRSRVTNEQVVPKMAEGVESPVRISSLPRAAPVQGQGGKMVAEESQRRAISSDLLAMLRGSAPASTRGNGDDDDEDEESDDDLGFSTVQQRRNAAGAGAKDPLTLRKKSSDGSAVAGLSSPSSTNSTSAAGRAVDGYLAGIRLDEISKGWGKDASHPLSSKFAVLSAANGCEMEERKTVSACSLRPYELLELQWAIPTERVYVPPIGLADVIRPPATTTGASAGGRKMFKASSSRGELDAGPEVDSICLEPYFEGWVYVLKPDKGKKMGKWKLHWVTVKGWRVDLYRKKPRAGEAVLPIADQTWSLRAVEWVWESESVVPSNTALPALESLPARCLSVGFTARTAAGAGGSMVGSPNTLSTGGAGSEGLVLTVRCINGFDHDSLSCVLTRAWYRSSATSCSVDMWRRKAIFRAMVAGRGGTVASGRAGRGRGSRNSKARTRLRPSGWAREWEDADLWSSGSEREQVSPPPELVVRVEGERERRGTVTQVKVDRVGGRGEKSEVDERGVVAGGLYAALLGRSPATAVGEAGAESSPYHQGSSSSSSTNARQQRKGRQPNQEPGLMLGSHHSLMDRRGVGRQRSGSLTRSPDVAAGDTCAASTSNRSRSVTVSSPNPGRGRGRSNNSSANSSRNVSREASPLPGAGYGMSPALVPGFVSVPPSPSVALLRKYKASSSTGKSKEHKGAA